MSETCPKCGKPPYSIMDKKYLEISYIRKSPQCWVCDQHDWRAGTLSLEEFEAREYMALDNTEAK